MVEYVIGQASDREEIIDFINMVFSQNGTAHDFKQLIPKLYSDEVDTSACHYLVKEDGKIKGVVGVFPVEMYVGGRTLQTGQVGSVSVHGYSRGKGYMKKLMGYAIEDSIKKNYDALVLSGRKNRYQYFGFQPTEIVLNYTFEEENIRHALKNVTAEDISFEKVTSSEHPYLQGMRRLYESQPVYADRGDDKNFYRVLQSWSSDVYAIRKGGDYAGYCCANQEGTSFGEILLEDMELFMEVLKAWFAWRNISEFHTSCAAYDIDKNELFGKYCEKSSVSTGHSWNILNFKNVAEAFMEVKNTYEPLENGMVTLEMEEMEGLVPGEMCQLTHGDSQTEENHMKMDHLEATEGLFSSMALYRNYGTAYKNWFPLPLYMADLDAC